MFNSAWEQGFLKSFLKSQGRVPRTSEMNQKIRNRLVIQPTGPRFWVLQSVEGLRVVKHKRKSRSVVATERLWIDLLRQRFYGDHFIKFDRCVEVRGTHDG